MVPLLGGVAFVTLGVFALGGATAAVAGGLRQEHPVPAPVPVPLPKPPSPETVPGDRAEGEDAR